MSNKTDSTVNTLSSFRPKPLNEQQITTLANSLDLNNSENILYFGAEAQQELTQFSAVILKDLSHEEAGKAGQLLTHMVGVLKGFRGAELKITDNPSFFARLFQRAGNGVEQFLQKLDTVNDELDQISNELEQRKQQLLIDVKTLDRLYDAHLDYFHQLDYYIAAGEQVIGRLDEEVLPRLEQQAKYGNQLEDVQQLYERQARRDELDRRLHDLRLTKQVAMQALPSIRLIQENNKGLVNKINSTLVNTVPLWRQQIAQSIIIFRTSEAASALKQSSDLTNQLLLQNAESLQQATRESRQQIERGTFDLSAVEKANQLLIQTIEESLAIHEDGRKQRIAAVGKLQAAEEALRVSLEKATHQTKGVN